MVTISKIASFVKAHGGTMDSNMSDRSREIWPFVLGTLHGNAYQEDVSKNEYRDRWVWRAELNDDATGKRMVFRSLSDLYSTLQASLTNDIETIELVKAHDKATKELEDAKAALDTIADKLIQAALSEEYTDRKLQEHRRELEMKEHETENSN
jgi:hypothetical protein